MGVMPCYREGCENIMCHRYSREYGYICSECFSELQETQPASVEEFMNTPRSKILELNKDYDAIFPED